MSRSNLVNEKKYELEKLRHVNEAGTSSLQSVSGEPVKLKCNLISLMWSYEAYFTNISLYKALFKKQARLSAINEAEGVSKFIASMPLLLAKNLIIGNILKQRFTNAWKKVLIRRLKMYSWKFTYKIYQNANREFYGKSWYFNFARTWNDDWIV